MTARAAKFETPGLYDLIAGTGTATTLRISIGFGTLNFASIALWVALDTSVGPASPLARIAVGGAAAITAVVAVLWASTDWMLTALPCTAFGVFAEIGTAFVVLSLPDARYGLVGCSLFAVLGAQFTLLMATRWLTLHLAVAVTVIVTCSVRATNQGDWSASSAILAAYVLMVAAVLTPWASRLTWSRLLVYAARSLIDPLTGLLNRSGLEHVFLRLTDPSSNEPSATYAVAVLDIDNFKSINDTHGHHVGDRVIGEVAEMLNDFAVARKAQVARTGGEEFAMLIPIGAQNSIGELANALPVSTPGRTAPRATLSAGLVRLTLTSGDQTYTLATALTAADQLMYVAKRSGGAAAVTEDGRRPDSLRDSSP